VDESMRFTPDASLYLLAAVIADPEACDPARQALRPLKAKGERKLHWHSEGDPRRRKITSAIAVCNIESVVIIGAPVDKKKQERARAQCLEHLLWELDVWGISHVWVENRTQTLNQRDMKTVDRLRGRQIISNDLRLDMALPSEEPMLWLPDVIAGAVSCARGGETDEWLLTLEHQIYEIDLDLR
jgi:hypothetical protein